MGNGNSNGSKVLSPEQQVEARHKKTTWNATLSAVGISIPILGAIFSFVVWLSQPRVIALLAAAMAPTVQAQVAQRITPLNEGFKVLLQQQITDLQRQIDAKEFQQQRSRQGGSNVQWTIDDVNQLRSMRNRLKATQMALDAINNAENNNG